MANPLDMVTEDQSQQPDVFDVPRLQVYRNGGTQGEAMLSPDNKLVRAVAPEPPTDIMAVIQQVKDRLLGTGGQERYQLWPERMVRGALDAPHAAMTSETPVTSDQMIAPAQDMAGLASGSTLFAKPGAGTLGSGALRPGAKAMPVEPAPVFYSALEHATTNAAQETMSPQQWLGYLKNQPGVKAEELQWTGIGDWLGQQKGKVKKEDVQAYLDEHKVEIKDVTKHAEGDGDFHHRDIDAAEEHATEMMSADFDALPAKERAKYEDVHEWIMAENHEHLQDLHSDLANRWLDENAEPISGPADTRYSSYQLPGGKDYREHLLTMPPKQYTKGQLARGEDHPSEQSYRSSHWDEPNVLAHVRTNDRDVGGKKSLHIEEIQSDWHQQGRKQGYKPDRASAAKHFGEIEGRAPKDEAELSQWMQHAPEAAVHQYGVPDAPFKTTWPELALKRMIRHAAENGYDRISWTPGEAQAARYDLSKQIDRIEYNPTTGDLRASKGREAPITKNVAPDKLADVIGKEAAERILNKPNKKLDVAKGQTHVLEGDGLKVGGEGMREFYDKMLPKMAEKIGKAHGVKVKIAELPAGEPIRDPKTGKLTLSQEGQPVHYFDLPQSLKDHAIGKGFPLYMSGVPFPLTPIDHDPFKKERK